MTFLLNSYLLSARTKLNDVFAKNSDNTPQTYEQVLSLPTASFNKISTGTDIAPASNIINIHLTEQGARQSRLDGLSANLEYL